MKKIPWNTVFETVALALDVAVSDIQKHRVISPKKAAARGCAITMLCLLGWKPTDVAHGFGFSSTQQVRTMCERTIAQGLRELQKCIARLPNDWMNLAEMAMRERLSAPRIVRTMPLRDIPAPLANNPTSSTRVHEFALKNGGRLRIELTEPDVQAAPAANGQVAAPPQEPWRMRLSGVRGQEIRAALIPEFKKHLDNEGGVLRLGMDRVSALAREHRCSTAFIWQCRKEAIEEYTAPKA